MKYQMLSYVIQAPDPRLLQPSEAVVDFNGKLGALAEALGETRRANRGVGLAAPQVGVLKRLVSVNPGKTVGYPVMVNPQIIKHGNNRTYGEEGCLSIGRGVPRFRVKRWDTITVRFQLLTGAVIEQLLRGEAARIVQHEIDHLDGKLIA